MRKILRWMFAWLFRAELTRLARFDAGVKAIDRAPIDFSSVWPAVGWLIEVMNGNLNPEEVNHLEHDIKMRSETPGKQPKLTDRDVLEMILSRVDGIAALYSNSANPATLNHPFFNSGHNPYGNPANRWGGGGPVFDGPYPGGRHVPPNMGSPRSFGPSYAMDYTFLIQRIEQMERVHESNVQVLTRTLNELRKYANDMEGELRDTIESLAGKISSIVEQPPRDENTTIYIVWNEDKTEGYATTDQQLAYEVRKSADSNCYTATGKPAPLGQYFCGLYGDGNCTTQVAIASRVS